MCRPLRPTLAADWSFRSRKTGAPAAFFTHDGYHIEAYFQNGVVESESITKADNSLLSDKDKEAVIAMESTGGAWVKTVTSRGQIIWSRPDGAVIFTYVSDAHDHGDVEKLRSDFHEA